MVKTVFTPLYIDANLLGERDQKSVSKAASFFGHNHEFIQGEKEDQEIVEACRRLIENAIVCCIYPYFSRVSNQ